MDPGPSSPATPDPCARPAALSWTGFYLARTLRREAAIASMSIAQSELLSACAGLSIAVVGNARSLNEHDFGARIDGAELVIRINRAPMTAARSHGTRTDWLALATTISAARTTALAANRHLWMSPKRKRLTYASARSQGFYLHPLADIARLSVRLNAPPTTGLMLIDLISRSPAREIRLFGFDFFASKSLSGRREAEQTPHDFEAERDFVLALQSRDPRLIHHVSPDESAQPLSPTHLVR
jgi:hypothetical protein